MNSPLAFSPIARTSSVEETEQLFKTELAESQIIAARDHGAFSVEMNGVVIGNSAVSFIRHAGDYDLDNGEIEGRGFHIFGFGFDKGASLTLNDQEFDLTQRAVVFTNGAKVRQRRTAGSAEVLMKCPVQDIEARVQTLLDRSVCGELRFGNGVALDRGIGEHAKTTLLYIMGSLSADSSILNNRLIAANFEELLLGIILSMPNTYSDELLSPGGKTKAPAIVVRAEEFMEASAALPITIADVLGHTGGSRKALLANFRKYRGYTPSQFLTSVRLKLAHQALCSPSPTDTVTSIAYSFGFSHLGRFAGLYKERYGVGPSETLRNSWKKR